MTSEVSVCKYFLKGTCHHGKTCTFRHQRPPPGPKSPTQSGPCKYFAQGNCAFGQKCPRSHDVKAAARLSTSTTTVATPGDSGSGNDGVKASPNKPSASKSNQSSVKKKGANNPSPSTKVERAKPQPHEPSPVIITEHTVPVCAFFQQGLCQSGDECEFLHPLYSAENGSEPSHTPTVPQQEGKNACKHFLRGRCRLGNECKYAHDDPLDQTTSLNHHDDISDKEISATDLTHPGDYDQFSPSSALASPPSPKSAPRSPIPAPFTPELDSGFEDKTMHDTTLQSPPEIPISRLMSVKSPKAAIRMSYNENDSDCQQEQQAEILGSYPAIHGKGKQKALDLDTDNMEPATTGQWDDERTFSPIPGDYPREEQLEYPDDKQVDDVDDSDEQQIDYPDDEQQVQSPEEEQHDDVDVDEAQDATYPNEEQEHEENDTQPNLKRRGSYYGAGWEEPEVGSPIPPRMPAQVSQPTVEEPSQIIVEPYPHVSEVKLHWSHFADPLADHSIPFCKLHAQGKCTHGESCRFRHSLTPKEYTLIFHDQQPNLWTLKRTPAKPVVNGYTQSPVPSVIATRAPLPDTGAQAESGGASTTKECSFFRLGKCRNGDICPFRHVKPHEGLAPPPPPSESGRGTQSITSRPKSNRACRFFMSKGFCDNGDACRFQHTKEEETPADKTPAPGGKEERNEETSEWQTSGWGANNDDAEEVKVPETNAQTDDNNNGWGPPLDLSGWGDATTKHQSAWPSEKETSTGWGAVTTSTTSDILCPFFAKGHCKKGNRCDRQHDRSNAPSPKLDTWSTSKASTREGTRSPRTPQTQNSPNLNGQGKETSGWPIQETNGRSTRKKVNLPCKRFAQGHCRFGDECDYLHNDVPNSTGAVTDSAPPEWPSVPPSPPVEPEAVTNVNEPSQSEKAEMMQDSSEPALEPEPITFEHPVVKRPIMTCEVTVGPDATPERIVSASDCHKVVLSGLLPETSATDVTMLCGKHGHVNLVTNLDSSATSTNVQVEFANIAHAVIAARSLNGYIFSGAPLQASLKARIPLTIKNPDAPMATLKVTWPNPTVSAWTHYPTISKAKSEASRLNDTIYKGYTLKTSFMTPPRSQKDSFCTRIERLPFDVTEAQINELCIDNSPLITLSRPSYADDPVDAISAALDKYQGIEGFDLLPGNSQRGTSIAFATFKSEAMARTIMEKLDSVKHAFLGDEPMKLKPAYYSRNRLLREQMEALKNEIDRLIEGSNKNCTIQLDDHPDKAFVWLRMYAPFDYGPSTHTQLEELLAGSVLKDQNGNNLWDDYFDLPNSAKVLKQLGTNAYIHCDRPSQKIKVFGGMVDREEAQKSVLKLIVKVRFQKHDLEVPRPNLHPLINGTLAELKATIGLNKVVLDVIDSKLIVRGTSADVSKASSILNALDAQPAAAVRGRCEICLQKPVDAIILSCYHSYCNRCLETLIKQVGHGPVPCIAQCKPSAGEEEKRCTGTVPFVVIRNTLSIEEEKEFLASSFYHYVRSHPDQMFFCPSPDCPTAYRRSGEKCVNLKCKFCYSDVCTFCRSPAHLGSSCP